MAGKVLPRLKTDTSQVMNQRAVSWSPGLSIEGLFDITQGSNLPEYLLAALCLTIIRLSIYPVSKRKETGLSKAII